MSEPTPVLLPVVSQETMDLFAEQLQESEDLIDDLLHQVEREQPQLYALFSSLIQGLHWQESQKRLAPALALYGALSAQAVADKVASDLQSE